MSILHKETRRMSGNRGCLFNTLLFLIIVFIPVVGHIIVTIMVIEDDHSLIGKALWLVVIWAIPFLGSFLYLVFGQKTSRGRVMFGQPSYSYPNQQQQQQRTF